MSEPATPPTERAGYRITRVYTKTGDAGETGLVGGQRVAKDHPRIESYGTVDELSSALGVARLELDAELSRFPNRADATLLAAHLQFIQNQLFTLGGDLATRIEDRHPMMPVIKAENIAYLERVCDAFNAGLPALKDFILPGGTRTGAALHVARTVCRRAERALLELQRQEPIGEFPIVYLNRLSDALFVLARWVNHQAGIPEFAWKRDLAEPGLPKP